MQEAQLALKAQQELEKNEEKEREMSLYGMIKDLGYECEDLTLTAKILARFAKHQGPVFAKLSKKKDIIEKIQNIYQKASGKSIKWRNSNNIFVMVPSPLSLPQLELESVPESAAREWGPVLTEDVESDEDYFE